MSAFFRIAFIFFLNKCTLTYAYLLHTQRISQSWQDLTTLFRSTIKWPVMFWGFFPGTHITALSLHSAAELPLSIFPSDALSHSAPLPLGRSFALGSSAPWMLPCPQLSSCILVFTDRLSIANATSRLK